MSGADALPFLIGLGVLVLGFWVASAAKKTGVALFGLVVMLAGGWFIVVSIPEVNGSTWRGFWLLLVLFLAAVVLVFKAGAGGTTFIGVGLGILAIALALGVPPLTNLELDGTIGGLFDALASGARWLADRVASL